MSIPLYTVTQLVHGPIVATTVAATIAATVAALFGCLMVFIVVTEIMNINM